METGPGSLTALAGPASELVGPIREIWRAGGAVSVLPGHLDGTALDHHLAGLGPTMVWDRGVVRPGPGPGVSPGVAAVVATSGTTAEPKLVELTHEGMLAMGPAYVAALGLGARARWLACVPLRGVAGLAIVARAHSAAVDCLVHDQFRPSSVRSALEGGADVVSLVPTMLRRVLDDGPMRPGSTIVLGGGPLPGELIAEAGAVGLRVVRSYGMTETWGGAVLDGRPLPGLVVELDIDDEIVLRGPMVMARYRGDPVATRAVLDPDGWFHTGDIGSLDDDGLTVVGRRADTIITGGENVSPAAVERVISGHPGVVDVAVVGRADPAWGQQVVAHLVVEGPMPELVDIRARVRRQLGAAAAPKAIERVDRIPRSPAGKILRRRLS